METVTTCCSQCQHRLGSLLNLWTQIGKRYISPVVQTTHALDISPDGVIRLGEIGTIVDNCRVQNVVCNRCRSILGSKCLSSAVNHVLHEDQLLLRTSSIQIKDLDGHGTIQPTIQRLLNLKNPFTDEAWPEDHSRDDDHGSRSSENYNYRQATNGTPKLDRILNEVNSQREEIERLDTAGYHIVASFDQAVQRTDEEVGKLKTDMVQMAGDLSDHSTKAKVLADDILSIQTKIKGIQKTLQPLAAQSNFGQELSSIRNAIAEANVSWRLELCDKWEKHQQQLKLLELKLESARQDLEDFQASFESARTTANAALLASEANHEEVVALKAELQHLRQELTLERSYKYSTTNPVFAARDMDILTSNITKIGQRASQVETLQMEFELLKGRVQRMETQTTTSQKGPAISLQREEPLHSQLMNSNRKVSLGCHVEDGIGAGSPSTVPNANNGHVSQSLTAHTTASYSPPPTKARRNSSRVGTPKLTKSGAVDKRTLKKRSSKLATTIRKVRG
ncbi:hypothetical protein F4782DRAFT_214168 [Xylaria castorea]|nr:hypothetical protein F4782DRAFT_214168 [Xylaria castorea]